MAEKIASALHDGCIEDLLRRPLLDDGAAIHDDNPITNSPREGYLVRDHHHGHTLLGKLRHYVQYLPDRLGVERRCRLIEQHYFRLQVGLVALAIEFTLRALARQA